MINLFVRNDLTVALYDVDTGKIHNSKNIKNGSATGSIKVPHDGNTISTFTTKEIHQ